MSYGKKDEDAELGLVKVDRTQVFQEGQPASIDSKPPQSANGGQPDSLTVHRSNRDDAVSS